MNFNVKNFFSKKEEKDLVKTSVSSETIWREINLFIPETIALACVGMFIGIMIFVLRFISQNSLELIKSELTVSGYESVAGLIMNLNTMFLIVGIIPFLVFAAFWLVRFLNFMPRKGKYLTARVMKTGAIRLSIDKIIKDKILFKKEMLGQEVIIDNPKKHFVDNTGKPFIVLFEGNDNNTDLNVLAGKISGKANYVNTINANAIALGRRIEKYFQEESENLFSNPMFWILLAIAGLVILSLFFSLKAPETTAELLGKSMPGLIGGF